MADTRTVAVKLQADVNGYRASMKQAAQSTDQLDKAQDKAQKNADKWRAVGTAATIGGAALAAGLLAATKAASNQEQALGSLTAVFKVNGAEMTKNAEQATQIGLSITEYSSAAAKLGSQLSNLGVDQKDLGATTDDLIRKASDLSAQFGGTTQEAVDALGAAMRGEADPAERYGLALNVTAVNAEMAATGADKAQAMMALINKQMGKSGSIGAWNREIGTAAAQTQIAQKEFDNATAALGEALLPAMSAAAKAASDLLGKFNEMSDGAKTATTYIAGIGAVALIAGPRVLDMALAMKKLNESGGALGTLATKFAAVFAAVAGAQSFIFAMDKLTDKAGQMTGLVDQFEALKDTIIGLTPGIGPLIQLGESMQNLIDQSRILGGEGNLLGVAWGFLTSESETASAGITGVADASASAASATSSSADATWQDVEAKENQAAAVKKATEQYTAYMEAVQQALGLLSARDALIGQEDRLAEAVKKNGNALRGYTEAAGANRAAMADEVDKVADLVQAKYEETGSLKAANRVRRQHINNLREAAAAAGYDADETQWLLKKLGMLKPIRTMVTVDGLTGAANEAERLAAALNDVVNKSGLGGFGFGQNRAAGGYITGPGTGTSDSIPANLSNGEYVMTAKATKRLGVGTLNAMNYAGGGLVGYAGGGSVGATGGGANMAVGAGRALAEVKRWREAVKAARENIRDLKEQAKDYADTVANNILSAGGGGLFESFTKSGIIKTWQDLAGAQDKVAEAQRKVNEAAIAANTADPGQRAEAFKALADAQRDLADAQTEQADAQTAADKAAPTASGILGRMRERANLVTAYASKVKSLMAKGLSMALIKDLAGADPIEAGPVLDALLTMTPAALAELGNLNASANAAAASVGSAVSDAANGAALTSAELELTANQDELDDAIKKADKTLDKKWRKVLAKAGLSAEERASFRQSLRDNDGKLTRYWRQTLAKAGLGAEERRELMDGINSADNTTRTQWREKLNATGLSAEERAELAAELANAKNPQRALRKFWIDELQETGLSAKESADLAGKIAAAKDPGKALRRYWIDELQETGLSAKESAQLFTAITSGDGTVKREWVNKLQETGLSAKEANDLLGTINNSGNRVDSNWTNLRFNTGLGGQAGPLGDDIRDKGATKAKGEWEDRRFNTGLGGQAGPLGDDINDRGKPKAKTEWEDKRFNAGLGAQAGPLGSDINDKGKPKVKGDWEDKTFNTGLGARADAGAINDAINAAKSVITAGFSGFSINIGGHVAPSKKKKKKAAGGLILGAGTGTSDTAGLFALSNGEYVVRAASVSKYGQDFMDALNAGKLAAGGPVGFRTTSTAPASATAGVTLATSGVPVVVQLDNRTVATGQLKLQRQSGGTVTLGG